jgi:hypothetical protein
VIENKKLGWRSTSPKMKMSGVRILSPTENGTKLTTIEAYQMPYSILGQLIDKLRFKNAFEKSVDVGLTKLKGMMEK